MDFDKIYSKMLNYSEFYGRLPEIRPSSVPFCPRKFTLDYWDAYSRDGREQSYVGDFYMDVGSTIHRVVQKWLPKAEPNILFGNWKCLNDDCKKVTNYKLGPVTCTCGSETEYKELVLPVFGIPVEGHTDGMLLDLASKKNGVIDAWILEIKSTSSYKVRSIKEPNLNHRAQGSLYVSSGKRLLRALNRNDINIKGVIIKYIARDAPQARSEDFKIVVKKDGIYKITIKLIKTFLDSVYENNGNLAWVVKPCELYDELYDECSNIDYCTEIKKKEFLLVHKRVRKLIRNDLLIKRGRIFI